MMPSRGLHAVRGHAPRTFHLQSRQLSSTPRSIPRPSLRKTLVRPSASPSRFLPPAATALFAIRHASTTPQTAEPATSATTIPPTPSVAATTPSTAGPAPVDPSTPADATANANLDTINLDGVDVTGIAHITEKMGYLKEIGLDYGWGPTSMLEWSMEGMHMYAGLPWWASIAATAFLVRLALLPAFIKASDAGARVAAMGPILQPLQQQMKDAQKAGDSQTMAERWREIRQVQKDAGISITAQFTPVLLQGVFGYCGYRLTHAMAKLPVPALQDDGFLWLQDLTVADPYLLLPGLMALSIHVVVRLGGESGATDQNLQSPVLRNIMLWGMPAMVLAFMGSMQAAVCVWFAASGLLGLVQSLLLQRPAVRAALGIAPLYKSDAPAVPRKGFWEDLQGSWEAHKRKHGVNDGSPAGAPRVRYQAPGATGPRSANRGRTIDVNKVDRKRSSTLAAPGLEPSDEMVSAHAPSAGGVFEQARGLWRKNNGSGRT